MTVLMTYHKLIERDSKHVDNCWKLSAIILLLFSILCCMVGSLSLSKLVNAYDKHCVLNARLNFTTDTEINAVNTDWGKHSSCDFAVFIPIFQCCFGIIFVVMFIICGKGGQAESGNTFLPNPWRIVIPSLIFFITMTIISIINLTNISKGLSAFCSSFSEQLNTDLDCMALVDKFQIINGKVNPSVSYVLTITFSWLLMICWTILTLIMITRIVCVVDFQLVRVTVRTCDIDNIDGDRQKVEFKLKEPQDDDETLANELFMFKYGRLEDDSMLSRKRTNNLQNVEDAM